MNGNVSNVVADNQKPCCSKTVFSDVLSLITHSRDYSTTSKRSNANRDNSSHSPKKTDRLSNKTLTPTTPGSESDDSDTSTNTVIRAAPQPKINHAHSASVNKDGNIKGSHQQPVLFPRPQIVDSLNGEINLPSFRCSFPDMAERKFPHAQNLWPQNDQTDEGLEAQFNSHHSQTTYPEETQRNNNEFRQYETAHGNGYAYYPNHTHQRLASTTSGKYAGKICVANEFYAFLKESVRQLNITMTSGPVAHHLTTVVHQLQEMSDIIYEGEAYFNTDLLENGHHNHSHKYCTHGGGTHHKGTSQGPQQTRTFEVVTLSPSPPPPNEPFRQDNPQEYLRERVPENCNICTEL